MRHDYRTYMYLCVSKGNSRKKAALFKKSAQKFLLAAGIGPGIAYNRQLRRRL
jgi:hypothetical protein